MATAQTHPIPASVLALRLQSRDANFKRVASKLLSALQSSDPVELREASQGISELRCSLIQSSLSLKAHDLDRADLDGACAAAERDLEAHTADLGRLEAALAQAKAWRSHEEQCDAMLEKISRTTSRDETIRKRDALARELRDLEEQGRQLDLVIDAKAKQFSLLIHCINELSSAAEN
jgi:hypothetical protein